MDQSRRSPDLATLAGVALALASLVGGLLWEGGSIRDILQVTAALIVFGGTLGAVLISAPVATLKGACQTLWVTLFERSISASFVMNEIIRLSTKSRKGGLTSLESDALDYEDPFLKKALELAVDGSPVAEIRRLMEIELGLEEHRFEREAKVFETAGGYAPTVGIIGAVLGLIQVMKHLENIDEVGRGIAVSFVATIYGVALANLLLLPLAAKLRARAAHLIQIRELTLEGILGLAEMTNTTMLKVTLEPYLPQRLQRPAQAA